MNDSAHPHRHHGRHRDHGDRPICGMALVPVAGTAVEDDSELRNLTRRLWVGVALSIPLVILAMSPMKNVQYHSVW